MKKKTGIIIIIIGILLVGLSVVGGIYYLSNQSKERDTGNNKEEISEEAKKFKKEYTKVADNNVYVYKKSDEIIKILENGTGVVFLGFPECEWCQAYAPYLDEVARELGVDKIYYYNIREDREKNTDTYKKIVELLKDKLQYDPEGNPRIYVPNAAFVVDGKIIGNDYETSKDTKGKESPEEYWTKDEVTDLKATLTKYMDEVFVALNMCTECNE